MEIAPETAIHGAILKTERLPISQLLSYGAPAFAIAALGLPLYVYLPSFYASEVGVSLAMVGAILWLARIFDVITDPLIGTLSDRLSLPGGRRKPWAAVGAPLLLIGCWFLFIPREGAGAGYLLWWSLVTYLGWTLVVLPLSALGAELSTDYHERTRITASREGYLIVGTVSAILLGAWAQARAGTGNQVGSGAGMAMEAIFWMLVITLPLGMALLLWNVPEPTRKTPPMRWKEGWPLLRNNRPLRILLIAYLGNGLANGLPATLFLLFGEHVIGLTQTQIGILLIVYFMVGMFSLPIWLKLGKRVQKHRLWCFALILVSTVFAFVPLLGEGDFLWLLLICIGTGVGLGVDVALPASIQADVIDHDTASGGGGRAGLYFALWGMATKLAFALAVGIAFGLLALVGFDAQSQNNSETSLMTMALLYGGLPVIIKLSVAALMWRFPLGELEQSKLQQAVVAERA